MPLGLMRSFIGGGLHITSATEIACPALVISLRFIRSTRVADFGMRPRGLLGVG